MPTVVITDLASTYPPEALAVLQNAGVTVVEAESCGRPFPQAIEQADALLVGWAPMTAEVIARLRQCRVMVRIGVGYDNIDAAAARRQGVPVCNVPDYGTNEVADHAMSLALALARGLPYLDRCARRRPWNVELPYPMRDLSTLTFGVVGMGRIGRAVLHRARSFRFQLAACDPYLAEAEFTSGAVARRSLAEILTEADILSLHVPLTGETRGMIDAAALAAMKPTAILVNTSRGPVVDNLALAEELQGRRLAAAGLDVFEEEPLDPAHPLTACDNVLLTPHWAWYSRESKVRLYVMACEEIVRGLRGEPLRSCVN